MKKGFTLIELLAVIIVLAIIALIATPTVINVISKAKDKSDLESVHGMVDSARLYYGESMMDDSKKTNIENLNDIYNDVSLLNKPDNGDLYINEKGLIALSVVIRNKCYTKQFSGEIKISEDTTNCTLGYVGIDTNAPTVSFSVDDGTFNSNGWAKNNFNTNITISDNESGPSSYKYCIDTKDCEPIALVNNSTGFSEINTESETNKVCVIGIDNYGNESNTICSDNYKLDKTNPTIEVNNISINKNDTIDLNSDVTTSDSLSGIDNYTYDPTSVDTTVAGDKTVTYTVRDLAGNSASIDRTITVITDKPSIAYSTLTSPNGSGWFNNGFYIKAIATADSTSSIDNILWCSTTSTCTPSSSVSDNNVTAYITSNSTTNKMCVQAVDTTGNTSDVTCSSNYKLDSVTPTLTAISTAVSITEGDSYSTSSYFNTPSYGISGGTLSCSPTNTSSLTTGSQTVSCTATSNSGLSKTTSKSITVESGVYIVSEGVNAPQLATGMVPIKWSGTTEVTTTADDTSWYDYSNKIWANAKTADGSYWVWVPRYAYKITSGWHSSTTGIIDVVFLKNDTTQNTRGLTINTSGYSATGTNTSNAYFLEPAFQNSTGNTKYGFWVAKFDMSNTTTLPKSVPNQYALNVKMSIDDKFNYAKNMAINTSYGWSSASVDTHMMTNYEWGAVAYLSQSSYGKNSEVWVNNSWNVITGCAGSSVSADQVSSCQYAYNTSNGMQASTTGNITGIYDMSGGATKYTASYVNNGNDNLSNGSSIINSTINKNIYSASPSESSINNYNLNKNIYGDAVYETSSTSGYESGASWYGDESNMAADISPWFTRGGYDGWTSRTHIGIFSFDCLSGLSETTTSFRTIIGIK